MTFNVQRLAFNVWRSTFNVQRARGAVFNFAPAATRRPLFTKLLQREKLFPHHDKISRRQKKTDDRPKRVLRITDLYPNQQSGLIPTRRSASVRYP
jgi:hypothetical protein